MTSRIRAKVATSLETGVINTRSGKAFEYFYALNSAEKLGALGYSSKSQYSPMSIINWNSFSAKQKEWLKIKLSLVYPNLTFRQYKDYTYVMGIPRGLGGQKLMTLYDIMEETIAQEPDSMRRRRHRLAEAVRKRKPVTINVTKSDKVNFWTISYDDS